MRRVFACETCGKEAPEPTEDDLRCGECGGPKAALCSVCGGPIEEVSPALVGIIDAITEAVSP